MFLSFLKPNSSIYLDSYKWGETITEMLGSSDASYLQYSVDKTPDNRYLLLSLSLRLCVDGKCLPQVTLLNEMSALIPYCKPEGGIEWVYDFGEYTGCTIKIIAWIVYRV